MRGFGLPISPTEHKQRSEVPMSRFRALVAPIVLSGACVAAEQPSPAITVGIASITVVQQMPEPAADQVRDRMMAMSWGQVLDAVSIPMRVRVAEGFIPIRIADSVLLDGAYDNGDAIEARKLSDQEKAYTRYDHGGMGSNVLYNNHANAGATTVRSRQFSGLPTLRLALPERPAAAIAVLRGSVDVVYAAPGSTRQVPIPLTVGMEPKAIDCEGCDMTVQLAADGQLKFDYAPAALDRIATVSYTDEQDKPVQFAGVTQSSGNGQRMQFTMKFDRHPAKVSFECYGELSAARATFEFADLPLAAKGDASLGTLQPATAVEPIPVPALPAVR
jgi:hypothetical protein